MKYNETEVKTGQEYTAGGFSFLDDGQSDFECVREDIGIVLNRSDYTVDQVCTFLMSLGD